MISIQTREREREREREGCLMPCKQQWSYSRQEQVKNKNKFDPSEATHLPIMTYMKDTGFVS